MDLPLPVSQPFENSGARKTDRNDIAANKLSSEDRPIHNWYRFVLSFPPHLVREYLEDFGITEGHVVLDPFCGTGTTLVECKLNGICCIGAEANPFAHFASSVKVDWGIDPDLLEKHAREAGEKARSLLAAQGIDDNRPFLGSTKNISLTNLKPAVSKLIINKSISPLPLHKILILQKCIDNYKGERHYHHELLALAKTLVFGVSNLHFGPEVGVRKIKSDIPVIASWLHEIEKICADVRAIAGNEYPPSAVHLLDAREVGTALLNSSVDAVITSPPYPNEKDYTRTTRLESVVLGFIEDKDELRRLKKNLIRSNTRGVYKDDTDDKWINDHEGILKIAETIEKRRVELGKNSGFEKLYARVTKLYFGGIARHLDSLRSVLRRGAQLAYVVGDQASYLRVRIETGRLIAEIAESLGYELVRIDQFRNRFATATKQRLNEEVVILRWKGGNS